MTALRHRSHRWWQQRAPRERVMLAVMGAAIAAFIAWYAILVPLRQWRSAAQARYDTAAQALLDAQGRQRRAAVTLADILQAARDAGVATGPAPRAVAGAVELQIDAVNSPTLFAWLERLRTAHGLAPTQLQITRHAQQLQVRSRFEGITP
ncbi:type II secretion system protein GspM [Xanthomonas campestris pv. campestris]|nr:type II secretion system protein GspM [Xanthomonas campestris pv. campestris]